MSVSVIQSGGCWCTADGSDQVKLLEYSRLYHPGVPDVETEDLERTNIKYWMRANVSETYWTAVKADTSQHAECHVVCESGQSVTAVVNIIITAHYILAVVAQLC